MRITAQLVDAATGAHLWADRYDRDLTDIFAVQDDVTRRIVDALKVTLSPAENARLTDTETTNMEAYNCSLRGRELLLGSTKNRDTFEQSKASFMRAIELDPKAATLGCILLPGFSAGTAQGVFRRLGLAEHLTPQRSNGFASMVERIYTDSRRAVSGEARRSEPRTTPTNNDPMSLFNLVRRHDIHRKRTSP